MNISIPGAELIQALTGATKVLPRKSGLPILSAVRFHVEDGLARMTATDLDLTAVHTFADAEVIDRDGSLIVSVKDLQRLVKGASRDQVRLHDVKEDKAEITLIGELGERTHYLHSFPADDWPEAVPDIPVRECGPGLLDTIRKAAPFASRDETRMVLNGVRLDVEELGLHRVVTTDGRRLCALSIPDLPLERSVTLPLPKFLLWNKLEEVSALGADDSRFQLTCGPWRVQGRLIEGRYPNWRQVVPGEPGPDSFSLSNADLPVFEEAVRTLPIRYPESNEAPLLIQEVGGQLVLSATDEDGNATTRVLPNSRVTTGLLVSVNRNKLKEAVDRGFVVWTLCGDLHPLCSRSDNNLHVLMPLRIDGIGKVPVSVEEKPDQTDPSDQTDPQPQEPQTQKETQPMAMTPPEYDPTDAEDNTPSNVVSFPQPEPQEPETVEDLLVMVQDARTQVRDLNKALGDIAAFIRTQRKQDKQLRSELANARGVLEKLRDIAA